MKLDRLKENRGSVSLVVIVLIIVMLLFGVISVMLSYTVRLDSVSLSVSTKDYYTMDNKAEAKLAEIDGILFESEEYAKAFVREGILNNLDKSDVSKYAKEVLSENRNYFSSHGYELLNSIYFYKSVNQLENTGVEIVYPKGIKSATEYFMSTKKIPEDGLMKIRYNVNNGDEKKGGDKNLVVTLNVLPLDYQLYQKGYCMFDGKRSDDFIARYVVEGWEVQK